jgi:hypothetical protein
MAQKYHQPEEIENKIREIRWGPHDLDLMRSEILTPRQKKAAIKLTDSYIDKKITLEQAARLNKILRDDDDLDWTRAQRKKKTTKSKSKRKSRNKKGCGCK